MERTHRAHTPRKLLQRFTGRAVRLSKPGQFTSFKPAVWKSRRVDSAGRDRIGPTHFGAVGTPPLLGPAEPL